MIARPVVDLPQPDSPTMPSVSPREHVEADPRHRPDGAAATDRELDDQVFDAQDVVAVAQVGVARAGHQETASTVVGHVPGGCELGVALLELGRARPDTSRRTRGSGRSVVGPAVGSST